MRGIGCSFTCAEVFGAVKANPTASAAETRPRRAMSSSARENDEMATPKMLGEAALALNQNPVNECLVVFQNGCGQVGRAVT